MVSCPCCGSAVADAPEVPDGIVAACDVLVVRALEVVGKRIVRADRSRHRGMGSRAWHEAHTLWAADPKAVDKGLADAWTTIPAVVGEHGCCGLTPDQLAVVLDRYARDLLATGTPHTTAELRYRLGAYLGVPVET